MAPHDAHPICPRTSSLTTLGALAATLLLGACAGMPDLPASSMAAASDPAPGSAAAAVAAADPQNELRKATEYWGKQYQGKPADKTAALSYAKNLKALGDKRQALAVLQDIASIHQSDPEIASELGRLALEFDQLQLAGRALQIADVQDKPDWKVISARGTVLAKQGQHKAAIPFFERALSIAPGQPSVLNNLAMATAMSGDAQKAEDILRQAANAGGAPSKVNQNLALVLGLQGKYDESKMAGATAAPTDIAAANTDYLKRMVRLPAKAAPAGAFSTEVAKAAAPASAVQTAAQPAARTAAPATAQAATALKPASVENTSGNSWQTAVTADAGDAALKGSKR